MRLARVILCLAAALLPLIGLAPSTTAAVMLDGVLNQANAERATEARVNAAREAAFQQAFTRQQQALSEVLATRARTESESNALSARFDRDQQRIVELEQLLKEHQGTLGELFGVTRQVAADAGSELRLSPTTTEFSNGDSAEDRETFLRRLATAKALPSISELDRLWFELQREMTASGAVTRYQAPLRASKTQVAPATIVRVGPFTATSGDRYLAYLPSAHEFMPLPRQPGAAMRATAATLAQAAPGSYVPAIVDPARGTLLDMYVERPNWRERIAVGGVVGYVTLALGALGLMAWLGQCGYLVRVRAAVAWQLRHLAAPSPGNPLGRVLLALEDPAVAAHGAMAELQISAAILREVPRLERFQGFLRLAVAAGPLLGLIGTVIGMIITFQTITASGTSDPKLVAHGIGQAMIATVLGLGIAIPLLFANSLLATLSRGIIQILDEYGEGLLADSLGGGRSG